MPSSGLEPFLVTPLDLPQQPLPFGITMGVRVVMHTNYHPPTSDGPTRSRCELVPKRGNRWQSTPTQAIPMAVLLVLALVMKPQAMASHRKAVSSTYYLLLCGYHGPSRYPRSALGVQK